jgi:hypothetical protein
MATFSRIGLAGMLLAGAQIVHAGHTRVFANWSDDTWTLRLNATNASINPWTVTVGGKVTKLDRSSNVVDLPPRTFCEVQFDPPGWKGATQQFELKAKGGTYQDSYGHFTATYPTAFRFKRAPVQLDATSPSAAGKEDLTKNGKVFLMNLPNVGDLTIQPYTRSGRAVRGDPPSADKKSYSQSYSIVNKTDTDWVLTQHGLDPETEAGSMSLAADANGVIKIQIPVPAKTTTRIRLTLPPDGKAAEGVGTFNRLFSLSDKGLLHPYIFSVKIDTAQSWPQDVTITSRNPVQKEDPWVLISRFATDGYLEIEDPATEMDFDLDYEK